MNAILLLMMMLFSQTFWEKAGSSIAGERRRTMAMQEAASESVCLCVFVSVCLCEAVKLLLVGLRGHGLHI